jgi:hypothetical protein
MGSFDESRAACATFKQQATKAIGQLQAGGQEVTAAQQAFRTRLGSTSNPKVLEVEARCQDARQKVAEAIQVLMAANEAAIQFASGLQ